MSYNDYEKPTNTIKKRRSKLTHSEPEDDITDALAIQYERDTITDVIDSIEKPLDFKPDKKKRFAGLKLTYDWRHKSLGIGFMYKDE